MSFLYLGNKPIVFYLGIILAAMLAAQFITAKIGPRKCFKLHKTLGYIIFSIAAVHAITGLILYIL